MSRRRRLAGFSTTAGAMGVAATGLAALVLGFGQGAAKTGGTAKAPKATFESEVAPVIDRNCIRCHSSAKATAGLDLEKYADEKSAMKARAVWERVLANVATGHMPPAEAAQPRPEQRARMVAYLSALLSRCEEPDPGRVTMRRLNREEYNNTIRDLTGLDLRPADDFPSDDVGHGFDNIGDTLSISPLLMEKYLDAAHRVARAAIVSPPKRIELDLAQFSTDGSIVSEDVLLFYSTATASAKFEVAQAGTYRIRVKASADQAGPELAKVDVLVDGGRVAQMEVKAKRGDFEWVEAVVPLRAGARRLGVSFANDYYVEEAKADRNLLVAMVEIVPTQTAAALPKSHRRIVDIPLNARNEVWAARSILRRFASKAWRRPATDEEVNRLSTLVKGERKRGRSIEEAIRLGVEAVLASPHFIFHVEEDRAAGLDAHEVASRLSYFLWSSLPDDRLRALAANGEIRKPEILAVEARRMLRDPRVKALWRSFGEQWLTVRNLAIAQPDPDSYPGFNDALRRAMTTETRLFFEHIVAQDRPVTDFLDARYTFVNKPLAEFYGLKGVEGAGFRMVSLEGTPRAGVMTQGSILTLTSNPTRTSPVKRGKWVLEQILNTPPPPPPPGVGDLKDEGKRITGKTLRQRMEQHRADPTCASCHARMDPIGFSLENFDGVGRWREEDGGQPIDASGVLNDGTRFAGPRELTQLLIKRRPQFVRALSEKMLTFALGRGLRPADRCYVDEVAVATERGGYRFSSMIAAIVRSDAFRTRRPSRTSSPTRIAQASADPGTPTALQGKPKRTR